MPSRRRPAWSWATLQGLIAACLLVGGGSDALGAIQAVAVTVGLPFTMIMIVMMVSLYLGLHWFLSIEKYVCEYMEGLFLFENL